MRADLVRVTGRAGRNLLGRSIVVRVQDGGVAPGNGGDHAIVQVDDGDASVWFADEGKESSERRYVGDAWAHRGDEGRGKLR